MQKKIKFDLYIMGCKGFSVLVSLIQAGYAGKIGIVIYGIDKNIENDYSLEIKKLCSLNKLDVQERNIKIETKSNYIIAVGWRWIIDSKQKILVMHDSLLPKYRGFAPLVNMLINGEDRIGVSAIWATKDYDRGNIIKQKSVNIQYPLKINEAINIISKIYGELIVEVIKIISNEPNFLGKKQLERQASYSVWRDADDYRINWNNNAEQIKRFCDAVGYPYLGAKTKFNNTEIRIIDVEIVKDIYIINREDHIGKIIFYNQEPVIICGKGLIKLKKFLPKIKFNFRTRFL